MTAAAIMPSVTTIEIAIHTANLAICGLPAPNSFETRVLTVEKVTSGQTFIRTYSHKQVMQQSF